MLQRMLGRTSVGLKIFFIGFLPLMGLTVIAIRAILRDATTAHEVAELESFRSHFSDLHHELVRERMATALFTSGTVKDDREMRSQQRATDVALSDFMSYAKSLDASDLGQTFDKQVSAFQERLGELEGLRTQILDSSTTTEGERQYGKLIQDAIDLMASGAKAIKDPGITTRMAHYISWLKRAERMALIDLLLGEVIGHGAFQAGQLTRLCVVMGEEHIYDSEVIGSPSPALRARLERFYDGDDQRQHRQTSEEAIAAAEQGQEGFAAWVAQQDLANWIKATYRRNTETVAIQQEMDLEITALGRKKERLVWLESIASIAFVLLTLILSLATRNYLTRAIGTCLNFNRQIADGDLTTTLEYEQRDELGSLMGTMNSMISKLTTLIAAIIGHADQVRRLADLLSASSSSMRKSLRGFFVDTQEVGKAVSRLNEAGHDGEVTLPHLLRHTSQIMSNISEVELAAGQMSVEIQSCSTNTRKMALQTTSLAGAMEEMSASLEEIRQSSERSSRTTEEVAVRTSQGVAEVNELDRLTHAVEEVTRVVANLAAQTHLLSLNASIEAANAGVAGRGFAVVANEVKDLAARSTEAAERIQASIRAMRTKSQEAAKSIRGVGNLISTLEEANQLVASAVTEQAAAMSELSKGVEHLANHATEIDERLESTARNAEKVAAQVEEATPGVAAIRDGVAALQEQTQSIQRIMEHNGIEMQTSAREVEQSHEQAQEMAKVANHLNLSVSIFQIKGLAKAS